jgi:hypothetical protein
MALGTGSLVATTVGFTAKVKWPARLWRTAASLFQSSAENGSFNAKLKFLFGLVSIR